MNIHMDRADTSTAVNGEIDVDKMKKFIAYCKWYGSSEPFLSLFLFYFISRKCAPRLSEDAMEMLSSHFVSLRRQVQQVEKDNDERSSIPITIR
jgi:DNA replication licensing factor MCM5